MSKTASKKLFISLVLLIAIISVSTFAFVGCKEKTDFTVGIIQFVHIDALKQANQGFTTRLTELLQKEGKTVTFNDKNADGDIANNTTAIDGMVSRNVDLIYAIATPSAQTALTKTKQAGTNIPVIFNAVTDPIDAGLVTGKENNTTNCTGCSDLAGDGLSLQFELMLDLEPNLTGIGYIYSSNEDNSRVQKEKLQALIDAHNTNNGTSIKLIEAAIDKADDLQTAYNRVAKKAQIIYMPTDNVVSENADALHIHNKNNKKLPIVCGEIIPNNKCGIATYGINYEKLGFKAAEMAVEILMGRKSAKDIPYYQPTELDFKINDEVANELGYIIPQSVRDRG